MSTVPAPNRLRAVLFDMDGTLVETEGYWGEAMAELAESLGGRMSAEARRSTVGTSMRTSMLILHADLGVTRDEDQLQADAGWVMDRTAQLMRSGIAWQPGARELLVEVHAARLRTALVTTTPRSIAEIVLQSIREDLGVDPFDVTVCGDEVPARKPDPAPYRQAMSALDVEPGECVVIEDSEVGIASGLAAGVAVLGVPAMQAVDPAPGLTLRESLAGTGVPFLEHLLRPGDLVPVDTLTARG
jgi:HAD superfamily hydrolase (TIGR01509 family)